MLHHARASPLSILGQHVSALVNSRTLLRIMSIKVAAGPSGGESASE
jgi:hypothetical protein